MPKKLFIDIEKCVGCLSCVLACSLEHGDRIGPCDSRIMPVRLKKQVVNIPVGCRQCLKPLCLEACPMGAIKRDPATEAKVVDPELCIGCGMCMTACPLGGVAVSREAGHAVKCDLCGGDPRCVTYCPAKVLRLTDADLVSRKKMRTFARSLASVDADRADPDQSDENRAEKGRD